MSKKGEKYPPEPLTTDEVLALIAATPRRGLTALRNRAMLILLWRAGLRISELLGLAPHDVEQTPKGVRVNVRKAKGRRARVVAIGGDVAAEVLKWKDEHAANFRGSLALFCAVRGREHGSPITAGCFRHVLARLAKKAGLAKRVHAHGFRHTFALELDDERKPLRVIQGALGHSNARTTSIYLGSLGGSEIVEALEERQIERKRK